MRWTSRFVSDELWLRARRVLLDRLREAGLDSPYDEYCHYVQQQHAVGTALIDRLAHWIGPQRHAEIGAETFLDYGHRRFTHRLPFILAFTAEYARWLLLLAPLPTGRNGQAEEASQHIRELAAIFNLGIVLVDQLADQPGRRGDVAEIFGDGRLERLLDDLPFDASAATGLRQLAGSFRTPELRVLAAIVAGFFTGVVKLSAITPAASPSAPGVCDQLVRAIRGAYQGQLSVARGARDEPALRAKSVLPFVIPPVLAQVGGSSDHGGRLMQLGERTGEVFWRVDDLVDIGRDFAAADGNLALCRANIGSGNGSRDELGCVLNSALIETLAAEAIVHARAGLALLGEHTPARREADRWLEMYVLDWIR